MDTYDKEFGKRKRAAGNFKAYATFRCAWEQVYQFGLEHEFYYSYGWHWFKLKWSGNRWCGLKEKYVLTDELSDIYIYIYI